MTKQQQLEIWRRAEMARTIVNRHNPAECQAAWAAYIKRLGPMAIQHIKAAGSFNKQMAELLEPGKLDEMMTEAAQ